VTAPGSSDPRFMLQAWLCTAGASAPAANAARTSCAAHLSRDAEGHRTDADNRQHTRTCGRDAATAEPEARGLRLRGRFKVGVRAEAAVRADGDQASASGHCVVEELHHSFRIEFA
jgi:hypothetical protein